MIKVFLSHSSKQKFFVETVADKLGKFNVVYDAWNFESGSKTLDEIYHGIESSGIFVYFISNEALESDWVKIEINRAEEYIKDGKLKRFIPIIIDASINHSDIRIPLWIKDAYNLKPITKPTKAYDIIKQALRLVTWDLYPKKREADQLFIGRTAQIKQFEERIYDIDKPTPISIIIGGFPSIGRRKFIKHALVNSNKIRTQYSPPIITLESRNSIEDLIIKLYGLGYSQLTINSVTNLTTKSQTEKINLATHLLTELNSNDDILFLLDNLAIVNREGNIVDWYFPLIENLQKSNSLVICLISQSRVKATLLFKNNLIFSIDIPELETYERKAFFKSLLEIENVSIKPEDFKIISELFTGFPEQIIYTTSLVKLEGVNYALGNTHEIVDYSSEKVAKLVKSFEHDHLALQILKILSESEFLSFNILEDILKEDFDKAKEILKQFSNEFIVEYVGSVKEFARLNDSVKDYVQRLGYKLENKYQENLIEHVKITFKDYEVIERDVSDYVISFKEALKQNLDVPPEFLIPSHYVNAMRELYRERRHREVILLAERILQNEAFLDSRIIKEIRYWLCSSLARKRDKRILSEVQKIDEPDHSFLIGFYYRIIGRHEDAIQRLNSVLKDAPNFYRAKRELVQVYLNSEQFTEAVSLAKENYQQSKNNPYHIQSYFRCLIKLYGPKQKAELLALLVALRDNPHEKAKEMYLTSLALYSANVDHKANEALTTINETISKYPEKIYPYLTKLELLQKSKDIVEIKNAIDEIEKKFDEENDIYNKLPYLACKAKVLVSTGNKDGASKILSEIKHNFSHTIYDNLISELKL